MPSVWHTAFGVTLLALCSLQLMPPFCIGVPVEPVIYLTPPSSGIFAGSISGYPCDCFQRMRKLKQQRSHQLPLVELRAWLVLAYSVWVCFSHRVSSLNYQ
jgi:hypothetical protein